MAFDLKTLQDMLTDSDELDNVSIKVALVADLCEHHVQMSIM